MALAGCAATPPEPVGPIPFRNPTSAIGSTSRFDPVRFAGDWEVIAQFGAPEETIRRYAYDPATGVMTETGNGPRRMYRVAASGVMDQIDPPEPAKLVVMWLDEGQRTAAIGTASGSRGAVLDRSGFPREDRLAAATEILDFYGWDTRRLNRRPQ